ncbi:nuclear transport factor 2 family protein [Halobium salinum]|uniref:Nuclear transport factor 2 family protein n=1 Tax=Halobium salinum TaxID=1364940 RepID=A0ABD5PIP3_9EURY|nr:nuclear transport factor 2 family protein [Halobium salinum]
MATDQTSDLDVVRNVYEAVGQGDLDRVVAAFDDDIEWIEPDGGPFGGTYHGPDAIVENVFSSLGEEWDEFAVDPDRFVVNDDTVIALVTHRGTHAETGEHFEAPIVDVWELRNGKITRFQHYVGDLHYAQSRQK